jgi:large subunit ribosomal protein L22
MAASTKTASKSDAQKKPAKKVPAEKPVEVKRVESRATVRYLQVSPNKVRPVLDLMRRMSAEDAERMLQLQPRTAAGHVLKLLESAIANAEHNQQIPIDELFVDRCWCDEGPTRKWGQARARGRYFRVRKRSSHITIILARYSDEELRTRRGRDEAAGSSSAGGRLARRRADRVRASRAASRGETLEEHDHDHEDHDHEDHDHEVDGDAVTDIEASTEPVSDEAEEVQEVEVQDVGSEATDAETESASGNEDSQ